MCRGIWGWFSQSTVQCTERLVAPASRDRVRIDHVLSLAFHCRTTTTLQHGGHKHTVSLFAIFSALDGMIHPILHAVSSRGGSGTRDKGDDAVTRYVIRRAAPARPRKAID